MANGQYEVIEVRFLIKELTEVYVLIREIRNCDGLVGGWHFKAFPPTMSATEIMLQWRDNPEFEDPVFWPRKAP